MTDLIAVTGASGQLGRRVVRRLAERGARQRVVVRDPGRVPVGAGAAEVAVASFEDEAGMVEALRGVRTVFLVSAPEAADRMPLHRSVVRAAVAAGVERVVYTSFMGAAPRASFRFAREHGETERLIASAGLRLTSLRNTFYADVVPGFVGEDGVLSAPAGRGRVAWVAREDVARVAVEVLLDEEHADQVYDVSGPRALDFGETVRVLSEVTGRSFRYREETVEEAVRARAGAEEWQVDAWVGSYLAVASGESSVTSHTVQAVTGVRPWTFGEFLEAEPAAWRHLVRR
ncbi:SDR family oxidoreductase [Actinoalloteichus spitiensis]|uniref:SDR family oxidoreductase n=1 Tax=Actinoalloteichus spitiensis TaxID=252394 RepID=UPI00035E2FB4|nr:SDR family oxidoreductase [Actinoalloteichus spitiensis]